MTLLKDSKHERENEENCSINLIFSMLERAVQIIRKAGVQRKNHGRQMTVYNVQNELKNTSMISTLFTD